MQYVKEARRALDVIESRPELDARRVGYAGFSLGADMGAVLAGVDKRVDAYALESGRGHFTTFVVPDCRGRLTAKQLAAYARAYGALDGVHFIGRAAPAAILIQNGTLDAISPHADVLALYRAASSPKTLRFKRSGHRLPPAATVVRDAWLRERLR